jgi:murein DD-endopeptidase MepM/ murein hydrolase activator NlpD
VKKLGQKTTSLFLTSFLLACTAIHPPAPDLPSRANIIPGETITVNGVQNVYGVAREHNVSMRELIVLNNLQPPFALKPGQQLVLPAGTTPSMIPSAPGTVSSSIAAPVSSVASSSAVETVPLAPIETTPLSSPTTTNAPKQAPTSLAAPVTATPLNQPHSLTPPPAAKTTPVEALNTPEAPPKPVATTVTQPKTEQVTSVAPPPASPAPALSEVSKPAVTVPPTDMVWPVKGPIVSSFGPKGQGLNNDGINIGAPKGTPVVAAQNGIVVYAGSEMKGFGNLILIRHEGDWVTAYAHLDRMVVAKDAVVAQGDMIGTVGKTGNVPVPQLHFETRFDGKPVDPSGVIKN